MCKKYLTFQACLVSQESVELFILKLFGLTFVALYDAEPAHESIDPLLFL